MPKVLIVDDIEATRETIGEMLRRGGYEVVEACNGKEALKMYEKHRPDAVVTDILMPEMEGMETIRALQKSEAQIPIIAITGSIEAPYLQIALKLGAAFGLHKPFKQAELLYALDKALEKPGIPRAEEPPV